MLENNLIIKSIDIIKHEYFSPAGNNFGYMDVLKKSPKILIDNEVDPYPIQYYFGYLAYYFLTKSICHSLTLDKAKEHVEIEISKVQLYTRLAIHDAGQRLGVR